MTLMFIVGYEGEDGVSPSPSEGKRALLSAIGRHLSFPSYFSDDNFDSFFDCLTDAKGTVALSNASLWWRANPKLMGQLCQCFLDANGPSLLCVTDDSD